MASLKKEIIVEVSGREEFLTILHKHNPGLVIVKFRANWCGPCKKISPAVDAFYATSPDTVLCMDLDIDMEGNFDVYGLLKTARIVNGIPAILCYKKGSKNLTFSDKGFPIPDESCVGSNAGDLDRFFKSCNIHLQNVGI